jgi:hypothetical protein
MNTVVESFNLKVTFVGLTALIPMDVAVGTYIEIALKIAVQQYRPLW